MIVNLTKENTMAIHTMMDAELIARADVYLESARHRQVFAAEALAVGDVESAAQYNGVAQFNMEKAMVCMNLVKRMA
jgi:hypothetical protein